MIRLFLLGLTLSTLAGCPASDEVDPDTDVVDTGECPPGIEQQAFIDEHVQAWCTWALDCPDHAFRDMEDCTRRVSSFLGGACWDECEAKECAAFFNSAPSCANGQVEPDSACARMASCADE